MKKELVSIDLDLLRYSDQLKISERDQKKYIWDPIRKRNYVLQPEEFVRQLLIQYLITDLACSNALISVERQFDLGHTKKRYDLLVYKSAEEPLMLVECKNPSIPLDQNTFDQISQYNLVLKIPYLLVTNGQKSLACKIDFIKKEYNFIDRLPQLNK